MPVVARPEWRRIVFASGVAVLGGWLSWTAHPGIYVLPRSDFAQIQAAGTAWLEGKNPYTFIGPGREYDQYFPLFYPFTAVLASLPFRFAAIPDAAFAGMGAGLFAWAISARHRYAWVGILTPAFIYSVRMSQWAPLLIGASLVPSLGWLLACKPTVGAAFWAAYPSRRSLGGAGLFAIASLLLFPTWPKYWLQDLPAATHLRAPISFQAGPLLLFSLLRWRRPEARLLAALSVIPQTPELYETLPLFLIPNSAGQAALLAALNYGIVFARGNLPVPPDYIGDTALTGQWMVWLQYVPCLIMILARSNSETAPTRDAMTSGPDARATLSPTA